MFQCNMHDTCEEAAHQANRANHDLFRASQQRQNFALGVPTEEEANADRNGSEAIVATTDNTQDITPAPNQGTFWDDDNRPVIMPSKPVSRNAHSRKLPPGVDGRWKGGCRGVREETRLPANQEENATVAMQTCTLGPDVAAQSMEGQVVNNIVQRRSSAFECVTELGVDHRDRDESVGLWPKSHKSDEYFLVRTWLILKLLDFCGILSCKWARGNT